MAATRLSRLAGAGLAALLASGAAIAQPDASADAAAAPGAEAVLRPLVVTGVRASLATAQDSNYPEPAFRPVWQERPEGRGFKPESVLR